VKLKRSPGTPALAAPYQLNTSQRDLHIGTEFETAEPESCEVAGESRPLAATEVKQMSAQRFAVQHPRYLEGQACKAASLPHQASGLYSSRNSAYARFVRSWQPPNR